MIISIHSFRGGTGKSNTTANIAAVLAGEGRRVAVVDTDLQSPGIHVLFGADQERLDGTLNDYLWGTRAIEDVAHDVTARGLAGEIWLVPASIKAHDIARVMHEGYDVGLLNQGFRRLVDARSLDALILDTHPGLGEETLLSIAMSSAVASCCGPTTRTSRALGSPSAWPASCGCPRWCWWSTTPHPCSTWTRSAPRWKRPTTARWRRSCPIRRS